MDDVLATARTWLQYCVNKDNAHYLTVERAARWHARLGIPVVITTAAVSTSIFATLESNPALEWKLATGLVSLLAIVLAGLATFLNFAERTQKHVSSGTG